MSVAVARACRGRGDFCVEIMILCNCHYPFEKQGDIRDQRIVSFKRSACAYFIIENGSFSLLRTLTCLGTATFFVPMDFFVHISLDFVIDFQLCDGNLQQRTALLLPWCAVYQHW